MIVGLDPSTKKLAFAYKIGVEINGDEKTITNSRYSPTSSFVAYAETKHFLSGLERHVFDYERYLFIEAPVVGRGGANTTMKQAFVSGAVQAAAIELHWEVHLVHNSKWKKEVIGAGNATKGDIRQHVVVEFPWVEGASQDLIDAIAIQEYGEKVVAMAKEIRA